MAKTQEHPEEVVENIMIGNDNRSMAEGDAHSITAGLLRLLEGKDAQITEVISLIKKKDEQVDRLLSIIEKLK